MLSGMFQLVVNKYIHLFELEPIRIVVSAGYSTAAKHVDEIL